MRYLAAAAIAPLVALATAAQAEVVASSESSFVTRDEAIVDATPKQVWLALISPAKWWNSAHTWSADASNLTLKPQAGGCFCERIPEDPDLEKITLEGSVEHMRVIQAYPERALRMRGGLGPLQSEPVSGVLTIAINETEEGSRIVWEYVVGGYMRYDVSTIAPAVDGVMSQQLDGLANLLGRIEKAEPEPTPQADPDAEVEPAEQTSPANEADEPTLEDAIDAMANS